MEWLPLSILLLVIYIVSTLFCHFWCKKHKSDLDNFWKYWPVVNSCTMELIILFWLFDRKD